MRSVTVRVQPGPSVQDVPGTVGLALSFVWFGFGGAHLVGWRLGHWVPGADDVRGLMWSFLRPSAVGCGREGLGQLPWSGPWGGRGTRLSERSRFSCGLS